MAAVSYSMLTGLGDADANQDSDDDRQTESAKLA